MTYHDYIIVGAGPAGLQMGYYLEKAGRDYLILEANDSAGSFFATQPRHRTLLSLNKRFNIYPEAEFNMRHDWNSLLTDDYSHLFGDYSDELYPNADDLYRYLMDFAAKFELNIQYNSCVATIQRAKNGSANFSLTDAASRQYTCTSLLMATGPTAPYLPSDIEGIELAEGYNTHELDPLHYENKRVLIIGRGNSAFEVANHLAGHAGMIYISVGQTVKHAWQTHFVGDLRAINNTIIDMYQLKSLHSTIGFRITKITPEASGGFIAHVEDDLPHWKTPGTFKATLFFDHVIVCTGWKYVNLELFAPDIVPEVDAKSKYPVLSSGWESNVPDLFFIGTVMAARDRQAASGFIHGFRYHIRTLFHFLENRYHGIPLPSCEFELSDSHDLSTFADFLVERLSTTSALYQLNSFLCDVLVFTSQKAELFPELPIDYVLEDHFSAGKEFIVITLEYGFHNYPAKANTLDFIHAADEVSDRACAAFLHPVLRYYVGGELAEQAYIGESISVRYGPFLHYGYGLGSDSIEKNIIMNLINRVAHITDEIFPEQVLLTEADSFGFVPWSEEERIADHNISVCKFSNQNTTHVVG